jgi:hypothetical protein
MAENLKLAKALREAEMRPTPRSGLTGMLADALMGARNFADRAKVPDFVPLIGGEGVGSLLVGKAPEEVNELSYGNSPIQMNPYAGRTASFVPEMKRGRGQQLADALSLLSLPGGKTAASMMMGAVPGMDLAATVFHGSPHKFDRFDSSKIGTGEGAQAYGHGLYFAESPDVARGYQEKLTDPAFKYAAMNEAKARLNEKIAARVEATDPVRAAALRAEVASLGEPGGALYKVDLPDEAIAKMLDWDKPLSQQAPEVQASFLKAQSSGDPLLSELLDLSPAGMQIQGMVPAAQGSAAYKTMAQNIGHAAASQKLRQAGIPGIRYLDAGSRGQGQGSSNYVVFPGNENLLTILERNGQLLGTK